MLSYTLRFARTVSLVNDKTMHIVITLSTRYVPSCYSVVYIVCAAWEATRN